MRTYEAASSSAVSAADTDATAGANAENTNNYPTATVTWLKNRYGSDNKTIEGGFKLEETNNTEAQTYY